MADEIADDADQIAVVIRNLYASEFNFDQYYQLGADQASGNQYRNLTLPENF